VTQEELEGAASQGRHRPHRSTGQARNRRVMLRLDEEEYAAVVEAAQRAGLTPSGFGAAAALAAARGTQVPGSPARAAFLELMAARAALGKIGANLNQLAAAANSGDLPSAAQLGAYFQRVQQIALSVESAAQDVRRRLL
jgi:Bacterial mobilisation protein (MobC)